MSITNETEQTVHEEPATHKKKSQTWVVLCVAALCLVLILDTVMKQVNKPDTPMFQSATTGDNSAPVSEEGFNPQKFQERVEASRRALERQKASEREGVAIDPKDRMAQLRADHEKSQELQNQQFFGNPQGFASSYGASGAVSPDQGWALEEKQRVRMARRSGFGFSLSDVQNESTGSNINAVSSSGVDSPQSKVEAEIARVNKMLEKQLSGNGYGAINGASTTEKLLASNGVGVPRIPIAERYSQTTSDFNVGEPVVNSVSGAPPAGTKLIQTTTVISAVLDQTVNSDYSGPFRCMITRDVYDVSQEYILIPQGSRCSGNTMRASGPNEIINNRMAMLMEWVILPNGKRISFKKNAVLDRGGIAGLSDQVNYHFMAQFLGVAAYALLATGVDDNRSSSSFTGSQGYAGDVSQGLKEQVAPIVAKYLSLVPTITLRSGKVPMRIFVEDDIYVKPWSKVNGSLLPAS